VLLIFVRSAEAEIACIVLAESVAGTLALFLNLLVPILNTVSIFPVGKLFVSIAVSVAVLSADALLFLAVAELSAAGALASFLNLLVLILIAVSIFPVGKLFVSIAVSVAVLSADVLLFLAVAGLSAPVAASHTSAPLLDLYYVHLTSKYSRVHLYHL